MRIVEMNKLTVIALLTYAVAVLAMPLDGNFSQAEVKKKDIASQLTMDQQAEETSADSSEFEDREISDSSNEPTSPEFSSVSVEEIPDHSIELQGGSQTFFPAFADLFNQRSQAIGHPRQLGFRNQEGAFSQRPNSYRSLLNSFHQPFAGFRSTEFTKPVPALVDSGSGILGSGNFGVIRGGTFFSEDESDYGDAFNPFYNNGHGRPSFFYSGTNPRPNYNQDQFANFRDFADINTPSNSAFSEFVVVYANKNATIEDIEKANSNHRSKEPKNIIETLAMLENDQTDLKEPSINSEAKLSKSKTKLSLLQKEKKPWYVKSSQKNEMKDLDEPLLALS